MTPIAFNASTFRAQFTAFSNTSTYPDATLDGYFSFATNYISATPQCGIGGLTVNQQTIALNLLTAHIAQISSNIAQYGANSGRALGFVKSSTVKDVSYTIEPPKTQSAFGQWLSLTPYGQELWALLSVASAGGFYAGGLPETAAFRKFRGRFY